MDALQEKAADLIADGLHESWDDPDGADRLHDNLREFLERNGIADPEAFLSGVKLAVIHEEQPGCMPESDPTYIVMSEGWQDRAKEAVMDSWNCADWGDEASSRIDALERELERADLSHGAAFRAPLGLEISIIPMDAAEILRNTDNGIPELEIRHARKAGPKA